MANEVYANGREISCKAGEGKSICAFPDVCMTPPENPATPPGVPVPYPNTGMTSDTTSGTTTVKISGQEVMLKNKSYFKQSTGDEAGAAAKKGVVTSVNRGKVYFAAWSMDVKFEGENVVRHLDLTTHNHASPTTNTPPHPYLDSQSIANPPECKELDGMLDATMNEGELPSSITTTTSGSSSYPATVAVGFAGNDVFGSASSIGMGKVQSAKESLRGSKYANYSEGIQRGDTSNIKTCDGETFVYTDDPAHPKQGHAEAKMIEDWFKSGAKGRLLINPSKTPCKECSRMINEVNKGSSGKRCNKIIVCESSINR